MKKTTNLIERTFVVALPTSLIVFFIIYLITRRWDDALSYVLGVASGLMLNSLQYRTMKSTFANQPKSIPQRTVLFYILKMAFYGFILYYVSQEPDYNLWFTAGGILTYRVVLWVVTLVMSLKKVGEDDGA